MLNGKNVLITGGTGSFGKCFLQRILNRYPKVGRVVIYSRDELKQFEMAQLYPLSQYPNVRFFIGDVRDGGRFKRACENIQVIIPIHKIIGKRGSKNSKSEDQDSQYN